MRGDLEASCSIPVQYLFDAVLSEVCAKKAERAERVFLPPTGPSTRSHSSPTPTPTCPQNVVASIIQAAQAE